MESINRVELLGTITTEPLFSKIGSESVAKFILQTTEKWKNQKGITVVDRQDHVVIAKGRKATIVESYLTKGSNVLIDGKCVYSEQNKNGTRTTEIVVTKIIFLDKPKNELGLKVECEVFGG